MPQFDATIKHIKDGAKSFTVANAVRNIEGWEATLGKVEAPGAKGIIRDLESLRKHLHAREIDGAAIHELIAKLGKETLTIAGKSDSRNAEKIKAPGSAAEEHEGEHEAAEKA